VRPTAPALPLPGADAIASGSTLLALLRRALLAALALALAAAVAEAARADFGVPAAPAAAGSAGVVVLDLSGSMQHDGPAIRRDLGAVERALGRNGRIGLVVFSDSAGITLPATAPRGALDRVVGYFPRRHPKSGIYIGDLVAQTPWDLTFIGGTLISSGLLQAELALARAHLRGGRIYLISDLADDGDDGPAIVKIVARLKRNGVGLDVLRIPGGRASTFFRTLDREVVRYRSPRQLGRLPTWPTAQAAHPRPRQRSLRLPLLVAALGVLVVLYELAFPRLRFRREEVA